MENAARALLIAGTILIGVLLITLMAVIFNSMGVFSDQVNANIEAKTLYEFNQQFEIYNKKTDLTAQDVITIANIAKNYNEKVQDENLKIKVVYNGIKRMDTLSDDKTYEFIKENSIDEKANFKCISIEYDKITKKVSKINIEKI